MKVVSSPARKKWKHTTTCQGCDAVLEIEPSDFIRSVDDQRDGAAAVFVCIECNRENWISSNLIPKHVWRTIRR